MQKGSLMPFKLNVNGRATTVDAAADMPLLWVVRDLLNLKGTKYGCGMSVCGMCTLHVDGVATVDGSRCGAVRLLSGRPDHVGRGVAGEDPEAHCRPDR